MKKTVGKYQSKSARIGFHNWSLTIPDQMTDILNEMIKEAMEIATEEYRCAAWLNIEKDIGSRGSDPTIITVELPLGATEDEGPHWTFSLTELVDDFIELNEEKENDGMLDAETKSHAVSLRDALHELADRIDKAIPRDGDT